MNKKKISIWLGIGIFFIPIIFAWFTLRKGYTRKAKIISFTWLSVTAILSIVAPQNQQTEALHQIAEQTSTQSDTMQAAQSKDDEIRNLVLSKAKQYTLIKMKTNQYQA